MVYFKVESSNIKRVGYDYEEQRLVIEFKTSDTVYTYSEVPHIEVIDMMKSESVGSYFSKNIKGKYQFTFVKV